jgi:hypothetical protein
MGAKQVSPQQIELFEKLTREKKFPGNVDLNATIAQFKTLDSSSASDWIERALSLEDLDAVPKVPPTF